METDPNTENVSEVLEEALSDGEPLGERLRSGDGVGEVLADLRADSLTVTESVDETVPEIDCVGERVTGEALFDTVTDGERELAGDNELLAELVIEFDTRLLPDGVADTEGDVEPVGERVGERERKGDCVLDGELVIELEERELADAHGVDDDALLGEIVVSRDKVLMNDALAGGDCVAEPPVGVILCDGDGEPDGAVVPVGDRLPDEDEDEHAVPLRVANCVLDVLVDPLADVVTDGERVGAALRDGDGETDRDVVPRGDRLLD